MRKLSTIRVVTEVLPIEGKDRIELVRIDGWQIICKKGDFKVGQAGLYFEIDSLLPLADERFAFLKRRDSYKTHHRLKTMRMGGVLSQGLLMPLGEFPEVVDKLLLDDREQFDLSAAPEFDTVLGITKYEPPQESGGPQWQGVARVSTFPVFIPKTDLERCQNLTHSIAQAIANNERFEITVKLDGTSITAYYDQAGLGVCSRNQDIKPDDSGTNMYWKAAEEASWLAALPIIADICEGAVAIQGELVGAGINGNPMKYEDGKRQAVAFDIYSVRHARYLLPQERAILLGAAEFKLGRGIAHVLIGGIHSTAAPVEQLLSEVETFASANDLGHDLEGVVFKSESTDLRFKVINNSYLLEHDGQ